MKKISIAAFVCIFALALSVFAVSCGKNNTNSNIDGSSASFESGQTSGADETAGLKFITKGAILEVGETFAIEYEKIGDGEIEWKSLDENVASVNNGVVTALGEGDTKIEGKLGEISASFTVKVEKQTSIPSVKLSAKDVDLVTGETAEVSLQAEYKGKETKADKYGFNTESGADVAELSLSENVLSVKALKEGCLTAVVYAEISGAVAAERLTVTVRESKPLIVISNAKPAADGYETDVAAIENPTIPRSFKPAAEVWEHGKVQSGATVEWTMEDNDFIGSGENGYFGKSFGSAVVVGTYKGESVRLTVNCARPTFKSDESITLELADGFTVADLGGNISSVKADDSEIFKSVDENGKIGFKLNALKITEYNVEKKISITTDKAIYEYRGKIVTDIITDESELNDFLANSLASATASMSANGYFILGNDIVCNGEYKAYERYPFGVQSANGFQGVFDGNGKIIKNLNVTGNYCGFIPMMGISSILKDVIFINGKLSGNGGFISCHSFGTIENVYIEAEITNNSATVSMGDRRLCASVLASESAPNMNVKNVFVKYLNETDEEVHAGHPFILGDCKPQGLIVVGHKTFFTKTYGGFSDANARSYSTEAEFIAAKDDWSELAANYSSLIFNVTETGISPARRI